MAATARDVDVAPFTDEATADAAVLQSTADSWDATFREVGFARIVGHGVPAELVAELQAAKRVIIVPGYGMAVARAQYNVDDDGIPTVRILLDFFTHSNLFNKLDIHT